MWVVDENNHKRIYFQLEIIASCELSVQHKHPFSSFHMVLTSFKCFTSFLDVSEAHTQTFAKFGETFFQFRVRHPLKNNHWPFQTFCLHSMTYSVDQKLLTFVHFSFIVKFFIFVGYTFHLRPCLEVHYLVIRKTISFFEEPLVLVTEPCRHKDNIFSSESTVKAIHQHLVTLTLKNEVFLFEQKVCLINDADVHVLRNFGHQLGSDHFDAFMVLFEFIQLTLELYFELL